MKNEENTYSNNTQESMETSEKTKLLFICYPRCTTCKKAEKWLKDNGIDYVVRDISADNPTSAEIEQWLKVSALPIKRFFNTSGNMYKELGLKDKLDTMSDKEKIDLLSTNGMLVKRPIAVLDKTVLVGFKEDKWEEVLLKE